MKNFFKINRALVAKKKFFTLTLALMATFSLWAETFTLDCNTTSSDELFSVAETLTQYDYSSKWTSYNLITMDVSDAITITNKTGATITAISAQGVADNNSNKTVNFTISDGTTNVQTSSGSWNNRKSSSLTTKNFGSVTGLKHGKDQTYTITNMTSGSYNAGVRFVITYTPAPAPATTHALEWDFDGGSCSATEGEDYTAEGQVAEGATITYPADNTMTKDGYDFDGWSTSVTTMPTSDLTIIAQWVEHTSQSSDATLSALSVAGCTLSPAFAPATTAYTIALPFYASMPAVGAVTATKNDSYAEDPVVSIADNVITVACEAENGTKINYTITVNIAPAPTASSSINIEQLVLDNSKSYDIGSALDAANIAYVDKDALDSLLMGDSKNAKTDCNEPYLGLKFKKTTSKVTIIVPSGESLKVKFGAISGEAGLKVSVNGSTAAAPSLTNNIYTVEASANIKEVVFTLSGAKTVVFKQIMVGEDIAVVRPFEATVAQTTNGTASVELPKYAKGDQVTVNCKPDSGYQLDNISVSGFDANGKATDVTVTDGKFTMPGSPVTITVTFSVATAIDNTEDEVKAVKVLRDGQIFIEKNGHVYNVFGACVK